MSQICNFISFSSIANDLNLIEHTWNESQLRSSLGSFIGTGRLRSGEGCYSCQLSCFQQWLFWTDSRILGSSDYKNVYSSILIDFSRYLCSETSPVPCLVFPATKTSLSPWHLDLFGRRRLRKVSLDFSTIAESQEVRGYIVFSKFFLVVFLTVSRDCPPKRSIIWLCSRMVARRLLSQMSMRSWRLIGHSLTLFVLQRIKRPHTFE